MGVDLSAVVPAVMVGTILILEHLITLTSPAWERWLFFGKERSDFDRLQTLDERLLTRGDLQQFLESILAAVCDRLQVSQAFVATLSASGIDTLIMIGGENSLEGEELAASSLHAVANNGSTYPGGVPSLFAWGDHWLAPLVDPYASDEALLGLLGVSRMPGQDLDEELRDALQLLARRAALAIAERYRQEQAFSSLEELTPQIEMIQRLRAASRYDGTELLTSPDLSLEQSDLSPLVKDALTHYWGGPKLTRSPLLNLKVVQKIANEQENPPPTPCEPFSEERWTKPDQRESDALQRNGFYITY